MVGIISPFSRGGSGLREVQRLVLCHTGREPEAELGSARAELAQSASCRGRGGSEGTEVGGCKGLWPPALEPPPLPHGVLLHSVGAGKQSWALNKPPLNVNWKSRLCRRCQFLMSLIPSGLSIFNCDSLLIWSQPPWFCDRNNGSGRWGAAAPFSFNVPDCRQGRRHLEGEGQIIKKYIS